MDLQDGTHHSFIVRIWPEAMSSKVGKAGWRGSITHVPDGRRRQFGDLGDIREFIASYLRDMGIKPGFRLYLFRWLRRWQV